MDGDGDRDLAVANVSSNTVSVFLGRGDGTLAARTDYAAGDHPGSVAIGDLDGDGKPDLAVANLYSNTVWVLPGRGDGTFAAESAQGIAYGTGNEPGSVATGDLDGDGRLDLIVANRLSSTLTVLMNAGSDIPTPVALALVDAHATPGRVELSWFGATLGSVTATVYRQLEGAAWAAVGSISADGTGRFRFEDADVRPGTRYGYRLGVRTGGVEESFYGETWISVPEGLAFSLAPPVPNPAAERLTVTVELPGATPARVEVVDVAGRIVGFRDVGSLGAGVHFVPFNEAARWPAGIYIVRLTQGPFSAIARACIVR